VRGARNRLAGKNAAILARYPGRCDACDLRIERGSTIINDSNSWIHLWCWEEREAAAEAAAEVQR
jgi:hypothetical protein